MSCKYYLTYHVICTNSSWPVMPYRYYIIDLSCHSKSDDLSYHTETCWPVPPIGRCRWYEGGWWLSVVKVWWGWECQLPVPWPRDSHHQVQGWVVTERGEGLAGVTVSAAGPLAQVFTLTRYEGGWWLSVVRVWRGWGSQLPVPWPRDSGSPGTRAGCWLLVNWWNFVNMFHFLSESFILLISEKCKITFENC